MRLDLFEDGQPAASANMEANLIHSRVQWGMYAQEPGTTTGLYALPEIFTCIACGLGERIGGTLQ